MPVNAKIDRKRASPARVLPTNLDVASERFDAEGLAVGHQGVASRTSGDGLQVVADDEAVADADFQERFAAYCQSLCAWSPITLRLLKRGMVKSYETPDPEVQLRYEVSNIRIAFASEDAKEARQAFFEKRPPVFKGK